MFDEDLLRCKVTDLIYFSSESQDKTNFRFCSNFAIASSTLQLFLTALCHWSRFNRLHGPTFTLYQSCKNPSHYRNLLDKPFLKVSKLFLLKWAIIIQYYYFHQSLNGRLMNLAKLDLSHFPQES